MERSAGSKHFWRFRYSRAKTLLAPSRRVCGNPLLRMAASGNYAVGGAREIFSDKEGIVMRMDSAGNDVAPTVTGAKIGLATRSGVAVWWLKWQIWQFASDVPLWLCQTLPPTSAVTSNTAAKTVVNARTRDVRWCGIYIAVSPRENPEKQAS